MATGIGPVPLSAHVGKVSHALIQARTRFRQGSLDRFARAYRICRLFGSERSRWRKGRRERQGYLLPLRLEARKHLAHLPHISLMLAGPVESDRGPHEMWIFRRAERSGGSRREKITTRHSLPPGGYPTVPSSYPMTWQCPPKWAFKLAHRQSSVRLSRNLNLKVLFFWEISSRLLDVTL